MFDASRTRFALAILLLAIFLGILDGNRLWTRITTAQDNVQTCRCTPDQSCWPSPANWSAFNASINGNLVKLPPAAHVCRDPTYDAEACARFVTVDGYDFVDGWKAARPNALPLYTAVVQSVQDVQAAVKFAKERNLKVVVKNTGHDTSGRAVGRDSLLIVTSRLDGISFSDNFVPAGVPGGPVPKGEEKAVTIGAGVLTKELYDACNERGDMVVAGQCNTVGVTGGYIHGGGISVVQSRRKGLTADLALEFEVVTADGDVVIANNYQNQDLFWALRGGGGGTFGVATRVTVRLFDSGPVIVASVHLTVPSTHKDTYWHTAAEVIRTVRDTLTGENSGFWRLHREPKDNDLAYAAHMEIYFFGETDTTVADRQLEPFLTSLRSDNVIEFTYRTRSFSQFNGQEDAIPAPPLGGVQSTMLVSADFFDSHDGPTKLAESFSQIELLPTMFIDGDILGGQTAANKHLVDNAISAAFRAAGVMVMLVHMFEPTAEAERDATERMTKVNVPILKAIEEEPLGMYANIADVNEVEWREMFWGENYGRLYEIKQRWDPEGLFIVWHGVGSEDWDEEGMCKLQKEE